MGQAHGKPLHGPNTRPSCPPDPFETYHAGHTSVPPLPEPPHSAPAGPSRETSDLSTDFGSIPRRDVKSLGAKPKDIARKISQRARSRPPGWKGNTSSGPTVLDKMKAFEEMVAAAEMRAGWELGHGHGRVTTLAASKTELPTGSRLDNLAAPLPAPPPTHFSSSLSTPAISTRPIHYRRTSGTSVKSGRISVKSPRRAEREWRAKVAALAHAASPHSSVVHLRGPVPPKRTPGTSLPHRHTRSESPASDIVITPPHSLPNDTNTPAFTVLENRSFETLGHHLPISPLVQRFEIGEGDRERKASVPRSVSSYYLDPLNGSRAATRPSSLATSQLLFTIPAGNVSPLRESTMPSEAEDDGVENAEIPTRVSPPRTPSHPRQATAISPSDLRTPETMSPALAESAVRPAGFSYRANGSSAAPSPTCARENDAQPLCLIDRQSNTKSSTSQNQRLSPPVATYTPRKNKLKLEGMAPRITPSPTVKQHTSATPATPLSPMTTFYLTAPIESINTLYTGSNSPEQTKAHPYSRAPIYQDIEAPPPSLAEHKLTAPPADPKTVSQEDKVPRPTSLVSYDPFTVPPKQRKVKEKGSGKPKPPKDPRPVLQLKKTQPKAAIVGGCSETRDGRMELERQREKLRRMGVDLTPGMVDGQRPPKSGLPMAVGRSLRGMPVEC